MIPRGIRCAAALCLLLLLSGCAAAPAQQDGLRVVATVFPLYDFARVIGGEHVRVTMLISPGAEPHGYDPTLADVSAVRGASLIVHTGGESDQWVTDVLRSADSAAAVVDASDFVDLLPQDGEPVSQQEHNHDLADHWHGLFGHHEDEWDEHIWTSPRNAARIAQGICDALCAVDPAHADDYRSNADRYLESLAALDARYTALVDSAPLKTLVFADRFPFAYLAHDYGLTCYHALSGCSAVTEPGLPAVADLIAALRKDNLPAVLYLEFSDGRTARTVAAATGAQVLCLHSCHNVTVEQWQRGETYITLMERNLQVLRTALGVEPTAP